jgi:hypothetical protein
MKRLFFGTMAGMFAATTVLAAVAWADPSGGETHKLRYQFHPGETLRWDVEHRTRVRTAVSGTTETVETFSKSLKVWRVKDVKPDGETTFEHSVEWLQMRQKYADRDEVSYDSRSGKKPPPCFAGMDKAVGMPLAVVTMDAKGKILKRQRRDVAAMPQNDGSMTIPLPDEAVPVGFVWSQPQDIEVPLEGGGIKKIKAIQQFTLEDVKTGVATIRMSTNILTPVTDPAIESKLVQRESNGRVRFDIDAGRILGQEIDIDKHVVGFRGDASSIHYVNRFNEQIQSQEIKTAEKSIGQRQ